MENAARKIGASRRVNPVVETPASSYSSTLPFFYEISLCQIFNQPTLLRLYIRNVVATMKSVFLYPYDNLVNRGCCRLLNPRHAAITAGIYTLNISILVVLLYSWRIGVNAKKYDALEDVYYGVQIAYMAIIGTQLFMIVLSVLLLIGIYKENISIIIPWVIGFITFMALEAVSMVYSNVLRDHVNKQFDVLCKAEVAFFVARALLNVIAISGVMRFCNLLKVGITWKGPEVIEL